MDDDRNQPAGSPWYGGAPEPPRDHGADLAAAGIIEVGDLLSTTSRLVGTSFGAFAAIALLVTAPGLVASAVAQEWVQAETWKLEQGMLDSPNSMLLAATGAIGAALLQVVLQFFAQAAMMYCTVELMAGRRPGVSKSLGAGFSHAWVIALLAVLNTLAIGFGFLFCIIPGVVLMCVLFASVPAAVVERIGPIEAMQRSADLTSGHRMTIFLASLLLGVVFFVFAFVVGCGLGLVGGTSPAPDALPVRVLGHLADSVLGTLLAIFQSVLAAVFYARARGIRDGVDADAIARVFE